MLARARERALGALRQPVSLDVVLFGLALAVFLTTRLVGLSSFPIYFFTDEAVQTVNAAHLVDNGFRDQAGRLLPTYLPNGLYHNLSVSVYLQIVPYSLAGFSVFATRAVTVVVALSGMVAVGLLLRDVLRVRFWWVGALLFSAAPAWFLHSRTAFETALAVSFYAWALYLYLRFRTGGSPRTLYASVVFAALSFYSYRSAQLVVLLTALLLIVSDAGFLWRRRAVAARAAMLGAALAIPQIRFVVQMPEDTTQQLRLLGSPLVDPALGVGDKISVFLREYLAGLDPRYWYDPRQATDLERHVMKGYGHLHPLTLPFAVVGLVMCLVRIRRPEYRALLLATLAAPVGAAMVGINATRLLVFVVPATLVTALGLTWILARLLAYVRYAYVAFATCVVLVAANAWMLADSLANGSRWYRDYGLSGLQYGGSQVTGEIQRYLAVSPGTQVLLSPNWANGTDVIVRFFLPDEDRVQLGVIDAFMADKLDLSPNLLFVMLPEELEKARASPKFSDVRVERTVEYPDGRDGFYFVRLRYSESADQLIAAEQAERRRPITEKIAVGGRAVEVTYPRFDMGRIQDVFDGDSFTLARTLEANPAEIRLRFDRPAALSGVRVVAAGSARELEVEVVTEQAGTGVYSGSDLSEGEPAIELRFAPAPIQVRELVLRVRETTTAGPAHVHVREIVFL